MFLYSETSEALAERAIPNNLGIENNLHFIY